MLIFLVPKLCKKIVLLRVCSSKKVPLLVVCLYITVVIHQDRYFVRERPDKCGKTPLVSVFHEKHVFEVCFVFWSLHSLEKLGFFVPCRADGQMCRKTPNGSITRRSGRHRTDEAKVTLTNVGSPFCLQKVPEKKQRSSRVSVPTRLFCLLGHANYQLDAHPTHLLVFRGSTNFHFTDRSQNCCVFVTRISVCCPEFGRSVTFTNEREHTRFWSNSCLFVEQTVVVE